MRISCHRQVTELCQANVKTISIYIYALLVTCLLSLHAAAQSKSVGSAEVQRGGNSNDEATSIEFREFFESNAIELKPSAKLLSLNGRRARLVGFIAQMERPPLGAFYLCPRPVYADESGGGTADLPVGSVRVIVRSAKGKKIPFIARQVEVIGILEVGAKTEDDGTVSSVRLILDAPQEPPKSDSTGRPQQSGQ